MRFLWSKSRELLDFIPKQFKTDYWVFVVKRRSWFRKTILGLLIFFLLGTGLGYWYMFKYTGDLVDDKGQKLDLTKLSRSDFEQTSYVYANDHKIIGRYFNQIR